MKPFRTTEPDLQWYPTTRRDETMKPVFTLATRRLAGREIDEPSRELFFVNHSAETLDWVVNTSRGLLLTDDGAVATSPSGVRYDHVQPGEAVKLAEFDDFYDCDELIVTDVALGSTEHGVVSFRVTAKGGGGSMVLLWEDGFVSPHCSMDVLSPPQAGEASS